MSNDTTYESTPSVLILQINCISFIQLNAVIESLRNGTSCRHNLGTPLIGLIDCKEVTYSPYVMLLSVHSLLDLIQF